MRGLGFMGAAAILIAGACTSTGGDTEDEEGSGGATTSTSAVGGAGGGGVMADPFCEALQLPSVPMETQGFTGPRRNLLATPFELPLTDGTSWSFEENFSGCDTYIFVPSVLVKSQLNPAPIFGSDIEQLVYQSPGNVHYFFIANATADNVGTELAAAQAGVDEALAAFDEGTRSWWERRLHVVAPFAGDLPGWVGEVAMGMGRGGFAIDRHQRIRTIGSLADVNRFRSQLQAQGMWPWEANVANAAYEAVHFNFEAERDARLAAEDVTIVRPFDNVVLKYEVETEASFPSAAEMQAFDTLEIDLTMDCPDAEGGEFGNCGEWDYLAHIRLWDEASQGWIEMARFISTYHRQGRYVVDATPMLAFLQDGGVRTIRYEISPPWNQQAYRTVMDFRLSNRGKGMRPTSATPLFGGGNFNSSYNDGRDPIDVPIAAGAQRVELWAIITGHGGNNNNCAEFCDHQHAFTIGGQTFTRTHPEAQSNEGCVEQVGHGAVPNQGGTWWFGRGGWCPGQHVEPWVEDVTSLTTAGATATVSYQGLYAGGSIPDNAGNIRMTSFLVVYE